MIAHYNVIVVGAGHAGCEAAHASATLGASVLLITMDMTRFGQMSCNPAMGGIAKGQIVREIDALGGFSGIVTDHSMIQFRMLNRSKGPAVWSPRAQCDRALFSEKWREIIEGNKNISIWQDNVNALILRKDKVCGVRTNLRAEFGADTVIITGGTFGNGLMHIGRVALDGGRIAEPKSSGITEQLREVGVQSGRLKTGTPARLDGRTIDFSVLEEQKGDVDIRRFSHLPTRLPDRQLSCFITYTNTSVHDVLREGFDDSPLYNGTIQGTGPRYCPSIEDKIVTFGHRDSHQLFLEPEGWQTNEYYINGFSSSLPLEIQYRALTKIKGLERVKMFRPGYAIEYDYFLPTQLYHSLESKVIDSLFFAGQVNGTTGYEEAAAQGLIAGINAFQKIHKLPALVLSRSDAYIGVLIDDLVTKGIDEPYRMFTSRAEYRILLRQDNADERLTPFALDIGMASAERKELFERKMMDRRFLMNTILNTSVSPEVVRNLLESKNTPTLKQKVRISDLLLRPEIRLTDIIPFMDLKDDENALVKGFDWTDILESVEVEHKYGGYINRERLLAEKVNRLDHIHIDHGINFDKLQSISTEGRFKLNKYKPETIGQAARIPGISPSDINVLLVYMGR